MFIGEGNTEIIDDKSLLRILPNDINEKEADSSRLSKDKTILDENVEEKNQKKEPNKKKDCYF